ncbi:MAG: hypothetical protein JNK05_39115 [Myxococcales bacterium]|nr:hypothetical protein [Myxococcales bacterium]
MARRIAEQRALAAITWKMDIDAVREETRIEGLRSSIVDLCEVLGIEPTEPQRASLADMTLTELDELRQRIKNERRWPDEPHSPVASSRSKTPAPHSSRTINLGAPTI